jgi:hypothetical protein
LHGWPVKRSASIRVAARHVNCDECSLATFTMLIAFKATWHKAGEQEG